MKFILTSSSYRVTADWISRSAIVPHGKKAVFIDTAAEMYVKAEQDWLQIDRRALVSSGFSVSDYSLVGKSKTQLKTELADVDVVFVAGGNSFILLEHAQKSGFLELLQENAFPNSLYVGSSAGSVIMSGDISAIQFLDDRKQANLTSDMGANIYQSLILPHWGSEHFKPRYLKALSYIYEHNISVTALTDQQYLYADNPQQGFSLITVTEREQSL